MASSKKESAKIIIDIEYYYQLLESDRERNKLLEEIRNGHLVKISTHPEKKNQKISPENIRLDETSCCCSCFLSPEEMRQCLKIIQDNDRLGNVKKYEKIAPSENSSYRPPEEFNQQEESWDDINSICEAIWTQTSSYWPENASPELPLPEEPKDQEADANNKIPIL